MTTALEMIHTAVERSRFDRRRTTGTGTTSTLVCSDYANSTWVSSRFAQWWVLIEDGACAGQVGQFTNAPLSTGSGTLTTADAFTSAIATGVTFSIYDGHRLPPIRKGEKPGYLEVLNQSLERTWAEDTIAITGVSNQIHYTVDTTTYPWWTDDTRIIEILNPVTAADDVPSAFPFESWDWVSDGETKRLRFRGAPWKTGESFSVKVNRPGNSRLKLNARGRATLSTTTVGSIAVVNGGYYTSVPSVTISGGGGSGATATAVLAVTPGPVTSITVNAAGTGYTSVPTVSISAGAWADQTTQTAGLVDISDECMVDVRFLRPMMQAMTFYALAEFGAPGQTVAEWLVKAADAERRAVSLKKKRLPRDANQGVMRLRRSAVVAPYGRR